MSLEKIMRDLAVSLDKQLRDCENLIGSPEVVKSVRLGLMENAFREAQEAEWKEIAERVNNIPPRHILDTRPRRVTEEVYAIVTREELYCKTALEAKNRKMAVLCGTLHAFEQMAKAEAKKELTHGL